MKPKFILAMLCSLLSISLIASCAKENEASIPASTSSAEITEGTVVVESEPYFTIRQNDLLYYFEVYDINGSVITSDGPMPKYPDIGIVDDVLVRITTQGGTGKGTQTTYFCNVETGEISKYFHGVFDQHHGVVAYAKSDRIIIQSIFDSSFYREISDFQHPFSPVAFPFENAEFINDGTGVRVTYLAGADYETMSEEFML